MGTQRASVIGGLCRAIVATAAEHGVAPEPLLEKFGRSDAELSGADTRVGIARLLDGWRFAMKTSLAPGLPVAVGQRASLGLYGPFGYALYTARTAEEAFQRLARYHDVINSTGRWRFHTAGGRVVMRWIREGERELGMRVANEQLLCSFAQIARQIVGNGLEILEVRLRHSRPADTSAHEAHFRAPLVFDAADDAIVLAESFLQQIPAGADRLLSAHFVAAVDELLHRVSKDDSFAAEVARVLLDLLSDGIPRSDQVADRLGISDRTLRRRLAAEDERFESLLAATQRERAMAQLQAGASVRDAAFAAGFLDTSSFARAFRRWTGKPPSAFRPGTRT